MNKLFITVLCTAGILLQSASAIFTDINSHWAHTELEKAVEDEYLTGSDGKINPDYNLTGAEMITILNRVLMVHNTDISFESANGFWYSDAANIAASAGYLPLDNTLQLDKPVNRMKVITTLVKSFGLAEASPDTSLVDNYSDSNLFTPIDKRSAAILIKNGILTGDENNKLNPTKNISRAEFITLIYRILNDDFLTLYTPDGIISHNDSTYASTSVIESNPTPLQLLFDMTDISVLDYKNKYENIVLYGSAPNLDNINKIQSERLTLLTTGSDVVIDNGCDISADTVVIGGGTGTISVSDKKTKKLEITGSNRNINLSGLELDEFIICGNSNSIIIDSKTKIKSLKVMSGAANNNITLSGTIETAELSGENSYISGEGLVKNSVILARNCEILTKLESMDNSNINYGLDDINIELSEPIVSEAGLITANVTISGVHSPIIGRAQWFFDGVADNNFSSYSFDIKDSKSSSYSYHLKFNDYKSNYHNIAFAISYLNPMTGIDENIYVSKDVYIPDYQDIILNSLWTSPFIGSNWHENISSEFGYRYHPIYGSWKLHTGTDIAYPTGTEIHAVKDGIVTAASYSSGYGYRVIIDHGANIETLYAHCSILLVEEGQQVKQGDVIALVGSTGLSTEPHLHLHLKVDDEYTNPKFYIPTENTVTY